MIEVLDEFLKTLGREEIGSVLYMAKNYATKSQACHKSDPLYSQNYVMHTIDIKENVSFDINVDKFTTTNKRVKTSTNSKKISFSPDL